MLCVENVNKKWIIMINCDQESVCTNVDVLTLLHRVTEIKNI